MKMEGEYGLKDEARAEVLAALFKTTQEEGLAAVQLLNECGYTIYRKRVVNQRRKRVTARAMTSELAGEIRMYVAAHSWMNQQEVGAHFGVSAGRVSEALNGLR